MRSRQGKRTGSELPRNVKLSVSAFGFEKVKLKGYVSEADVYKTQGRVYSFSAGDGTVSSEGMK